MWPFKAKTDECKPDKLEIIGVTLGWNMKPTLCFPGGNILPRGLDKILYPQYYENGDWPTDPLTKERLPIAK
jgi:hypothetical protein